MSAIDTRRTAKRRIDSLSPDRLRVADDFLAYLQERESNEATDELLSLPGFIERLEKAEKQIADGKVTPVDKLRRVWRGVTLLLVALLASACSSLQNVSPGPIRAAMRSEMDVFPAKVGSSPLSTPGIAVYFPESGQHTEEMWRQSLRYLIVQGLKRNFLRVVESPDGSSKADDILVICRGFAATCTLPIAYTSPYRATVSCCWELRMADGKPLASKQITAKGSGSAAGLLNFDDPQKQHDQALGRALGAAIERCAQEGVAFVATTSTVKGGTR